MATDFDPSKLTLSHPYDFFRVKHIEVEPGFCFILMPFAAEFQIVFDVIQKNLAGLMTCSRADDLGLSDPILERVLTGIARADLIIADMTGKNPNVFYELGIAQTRTKNVLLLSQNPAEVPFDLHHFHCLKYSTTSQNGLDHLATCVREAAEQVSAQRSNKPLDSPIARTQRIVDFMRRKLEDKAAGSLLIRIQAGISALGHVRSPKASPEIEIYEDLLEMERELLLELVEAGASLQMVLTPYQTLKHLRTERINRPRRIKEVLKSLARLEAHLGRCQLAIAPNPGSNLMFFGDEILFEGHKTTVGRGFGLTLVYTDPRVLRLRVQAFEQFFESAREYTLRKYGKDAGTGDPLHQAVLTALDRIRMPDH